MNDIETIVAGDLSVAYHDLGRPDGAPMILLHGFPYSAHGYREAATILAEAGHRVIVPHLRGYGPTRFLKAETLRSGEQAALGADLLALMDALAIPEAVLGGYDWGGRAACIVAALWPERVRGLVSCGSGYNIQDIAGAMRPAAAEVEMSLWYQYYFHSPRGEAGLSENRNSIARLLWKMWSPPWAFSEASFAESAAAFDNDDFVRVVIHSYRHRFGLVAGDPAYASIEAKLAKAPEIPVPAIILQGESDGVDPPRLDDPGRDRFTALRAWHRLPDVGHNPPQEAPALFAEAMLALA